MTATTTKATQAVLNFLVNVDLEAWRANVPITGDNVTDRPVLRDKLFTFVIQGCGDLLTTDKQTRLTAQLNSQLAVTALDSVDWDTVLSIWQSNS